MSLKNKILYSVDAGLFISAIIILLFSESNTGEVIERQLIFSLLFGIAYFLFPFIDMEKKEKISYIIIAHIVLSLASIFTLYYSLKFYTNNINGGFLLFEVFAALGIIFGFSYLSYVFIAFVRSLLHIILKIKVYLFGNTVRENYSAAKKFIEGITAFIVAVTAMVASVSAFTSLISTLLN